MAGSPTTSGRVGGGVGWVGGWGVWGWGVLVAFLSENARAKNEATAPRSRRELGAVTLPLGMRTGFLRGETRYRCPRPNEHLDGAPEVLT